MSTATRGSKELTDSCRHMNTVTTETAGLERDSCETCGHVSMRFLYDVFEDLTEQMSSVPIRSDQPFRACSAN
jgi:hypothetical protein